MSDQNSIRSKLAKLAKGGKTNIIDRVRILIHDIFDREDISDDTDFHTIDSMEELRQLEIVVALETYFPIQPIVESKWNNFFTSIKTIADWLEENIDQDLEVSADEYNSYLEELQQEESDSEDVTDLDDHA